MGHYYFDSSALVKRYVAETGTDWIRRLCALGAGHTLYTVRISGAEIIAALFRRTRMGTLAVADAQAAATQFKADLRNHYQIVEVTEQLIDLAMTLAEKHGLRGYDAVQLAAALELQAARAALSLSTITFVCADDPLNKAAKAEGLPAENPNDY
ncbi:MAG: type II toxin-antitoxin system VapC family toxin [Anaerolineae bacterium]